MIVNLSHGIFYIALYSLAGRFTNMITGIMIPRPGFHCHGYIALQRDLALTAGQAAAEWLALASLYTLLYRSAKLL